MELIQKENAQKKQGEGQQKEWEIKVLSQTPVCGENGQFFEECHAATCVRNEKGDLLVAYFAGEKEGALDVGIWTSRRVDGCWQEPVRVKYFYGMPHWNPILHKDGEKILLYYKVGPNPREWYTMVCESEDFGQTWSESVEAIEDDHTSRLASKNPMLVTEDGRWIAGCSEETTKEWDCSIEISEDGGRTWSSQKIPFVHEFKEGDPEADGIIQPALWQSKEKEFHCLLRSSRGYIYRSDSTDGGRTWCEAYPTDFPNNNSGITLAKVCRKDSCVRENECDFLLIMVCNPVTENWGPRTPLSVYWSEDNGISWKKGPDLETDPYEYSYPYLVEEGGVLDLVYTWRRRNIIYCELKLE